MANRNGRNSTQGDISRWEELGAALITRRTLLGYPGREPFAAANPGLSERTYYDIEEHRRRNFDTSTLTQLELAYQLAPGTIREFLSGTGPARFLGAAPPAGTPRLAPPGYLPEAYVRALQPYADVIADRLDLARERTAGAGPSGADIFPDSPADARAWDALAAAGEWTQAEMAWQVAELQRRRVAARHPEPEAGSARA